MGLLDGQVLDWEETKQLADHVRDRGISQFLFTWNAAKDRKDDPLLWGDETESMVISFNDTDRSAKVLLCHGTLLPKLKEAAQKLREENPDTPGIAPVWAPEYASYMLESTPGSPYNGSIDSLLSVETNMRERRLMTRPFLPQHQRVMTITCYPRLGAPGPFSEPSFDPKDAVSSHSLFIPEEVISQDPEFTQPTINIRKRRGSKITVNVPIFRDVRTPQPFHDPTIPLNRTVFDEDSKARNGAAVPDHIYLDATAFGGGCCCLQVTQQGSSLEEALRLYDALVPIAPIMLALTAAAPAYRGYLADVDCRWMIIEEYADDRTAQEREGPATSETTDEGDEKDVAPAVPKSRCSSVDAYISTKTPSSNVSEYNDIPIPYREEIYQRLIDNGMDSPLAKHFAHLFIRDPLLMSTDFLKQDDTKENDLFESIQSTNWQSLRLKPPPSPDSTTGWRVEFRTMEVQITDYENAAYALFVVLLSRAILKFGLNFYIPISKVDENMQRAQKRAAVTDQRFWLRKHIRPEETSSLSERPVEEYDEKSIRDIILGSGEGFPVGLLGYVEAYVESMNVAPKQRLQIDRYLELVRRRADGSLQTTATWIRSFVRSHPAYGFDSVVSEEINHDLLKALDEIERGQRRADELLPGHYRGSD